MTEQTTLMRRDPRYTLSPGAGFVEFEADNPGKLHYRAKLLDISVAGLTLELEADPGLTARTPLRNAIVHVGECDVEGELSVKYTRSINETKIEAGCLFYPSSPLGEEKWSAVIAGLEAAGADER